MLFVLSFEIREAKKDTGEEKAVWQSGPSSSFIVAPSQQLAEWKVKYVEA